MAEQLAIKAGQWVLVGGEWAYVFMVEGDEIGLSGWRGIKTKVVSRGLVKDVRDSKPVEER
jgi:hypothetical protein